MTRRLASLAGLAAAVGLAAVAAGALAAPAVASVSTVDADPPLVVLIGTSGLTWTDVDATTTPTLWRLTAQAGAGTVSVHTLHRFTCPIDGWLSVSSGRLAAAPRGTDGECRTPQESVAGGPVSGWADFEEQARNDDRDATLGLLGDTLKGASIASAGVGPAAAIALAAIDGVPIGTVSRLPADAHAYATAVTGALAGLTAPGATGPTGLLVVDAGPSEPRGAAPTEASLADLDARTAAIVAALPDGATVVVTSLGDAAATPNLQVMGISGGDGSYDGRLLWSSSTRQPGMLQVTDVPTTVLALLGVPANGGFVGAAAKPMSPGGTVVDRVQQLSDYNLAAHAVGRYVGAFFALVAGVQLLWYLGAGFLLRHRKPDARDLSPAARRRLLRTTQWLGVGFASIPIATYPANLVPWWRSSSPFVVLITLTVAGAVLLALLAKLSPWRRTLLGPLGVVAGVTALVLAVIVLAGSRLLMSALMGVQPLVSGRYYGLGNVPFALFASGALLAATVVANELIGAGRRSAAVASVATIGAVAVALDGLPGIGSDFGGPIAMVPAFTVLALTVAQVRLSWRTVLTTVGATVGVAAVLAILDYLRPAEDRTHLGQFVAAVLAGEGPSVVGRKLSQNLSLLVENPPGMLVPIVAVILLLVVVRPRALGLGSLSRAYERAPALRPGMIALLVLLTLGFAFNDSGTAVPAVAAALVVPLLVGVGARVSEADRETRTEAGDSIAPEALPDPST